MNPPAQARGARAAPPAPRWGPALLGLFPWFGPQSVGGVQLSGRLAWGALSGERSLFLFGAPPGVPTLPNQPDTILARGWREAARKALGWRGTASVALVWHVGLLKLLPLFRLRQARVVLYLHGIEVWRPLDPLTRYLLRRVHLFLSNSDHTWERFCAFHPEFAQHPHQSVPLGLGDPLPESPPAPGEPPVALVVSRLEAGEDYKGHRELIRAWPLLLNRLPEAELWVAGEGSLRPTLEELAAERGVGRHVRFLGAISDAERERCLARCRCFAMPSRGEGFGLVYLEAMRWGRPCLVSTVDAGREVVNPPEAGLAVEPTHREALAGALERLMVPGDEWEAWSRQALARYARHYTAAHFQTRLVQALATT